MSGNSQDNKKFGAKKSILKINCPPWLYQAFQKFIPGRLILRMNHSDFVLYYQKRNGSGKKNLIKRDPAKVNLKDLIKAKKKKTKKR